MTESKREVAPFRLQLVQWLLVVMLIGLAAVFVRVVAPPWRDSREVSARPDELADRLDDPSGDVRASVVGELAARARLGDGWAMSLLEDVALGDDTRGVRQLAFDALIEACPEDVALLMVRVAGDAGQAIGLRKRAIHGLGLLGWDESVDLLLSLARKGEPELRDPARNALAAFGVPDDTPRHRELREKMLRVIPVVEFTEIDLVDVLMYGGEYADSPVLVSRFDKKALGGSLDMSATISFDIHNVAVGYFLWEAVRQANPHSSWGLRWFGDCMVLEQVEGRPDPSDWLIARPSGGTSADDAVFEKLQPRIERLSFSDIDLADVLTFCSEYSGIQIQVNWAGLERIGVERTSKVSMDVEDITVASAMKIVFAEVAGRGKIACEIRDGKVMVAPAP